MTTRDQNPAYSGTLDERLDASLDVPCEEENEITDEEENEITDEEENEITEAVEYIDLTEGPSEEIEEVGPSYTVTRFPPDTVRALLAFSFVLIFAGTVGCTFWLFHSTQDWEQLKDLLNLLLPAETALLGSAVGFYFGTRGR